MYKLAHIGIVVKNLTHSLEFYTSMLGCTVSSEKELENLKIICLAVGDQILELLEYSPDPIGQRGTGRYDHIALQVEDIDIAVARLAARGIVFLTDKPRMTPWGQKIIFFTGPDGERIELVEG